MAQVQFRSDDTTAWAEKYGNGSDGTGTISSTISDSARSGYANTTISGSSGSTAATFGSGSGFSDGDIVLIHQSRNGGGGAGTWMLNKIASGGGTTSVTLAYALVANFDTTAQVYRLPQYNTFTVNTAVTLNGVDWDGTKGGIIAILAKTSITVTGTIDHQGTAAPSGSSLVAGATGGGYRGGQGRGGASNTTAWRGEGTAGDNGTTQTAANGNGGGGASVATSVSDPGGGGGANGVQGSDGRPSAGGGVGGAKGAVAGNAGLTTMVFGGGGGGKNHQDAASTAGGASGGGIVILIAPTITVTGSITVKGGNSTTGYNGGNGGGGSILLKGDNLVLGTNLLTAAGGDRSDYPSGGTGEGRIHADYATSISGSASTPTIDSRQDTTLIPPPPNFTKRVISLQAVKRSTFY